MPFSMDCLDFGFIFYSLIKKLRNQYFIVIFVLENRISQVLII